MRPPALSRALIFAFAAQTISPGMLAAASQSPASVGSPCTPFAALRGSNVKAPADGDVATVAQLCLRGNSVGTLSRVPFSDKPGAPISEIDLARDASLHPLTAIGAPDGTAVDIRSRNGNWTHLFSGALWRAPAITASGEIQALDRGHGQFSVAASLGYFAVVLPRFLARVKGTIFDIDFEPSSAAFSVSEGTVAITRTVAIRLRDEHRSIDGIRFTDTITANGRSSVVYTLPLSVEREFQNQTEAERVLTQQLQMAIGTGDPQAIDDAIYNLQIVTGKTIVGFAGVAHGGSDGVAPLAASAPHGMSGTVLAGIVSAAALTGGTLLLTNTGHESVAAAQATGPPVAASPSPAATASPGASPSPSAPTPTPTASASKPTPTGTPTASPPVTATATPTATPTALPTATPTATPTASPSPVSGGVVISATHRPTAPPPALPRASHR